jgi:hypothetical protein
MTERNDRIVSCFVTVGRNLSQPRVEHGGEDQTAEQEQDRKAEATMPDHSLDAIGWWAGEQEPGLDLTPPATWQDLS